jgi:hypothetical protein
MPPAASFTGSSVSIPAEPRKSPTNTPDEATKKDSEPKDKQTKLALAE